MSKRTLIVESDSNLSRTLRGELEDKGFQVSETGDGKGCVELIRKDRPELVLLAVDLANNQNGYLICGKLKKDDELKSVPVIIMGNSDGFAQHKKLKTRADDYIAKPVDLDLMVNAVGGLIGVPEVTESGVVEEDESLSLSELVEDPEGAAGESPAEEIAVDASTEGTVEGDPALDLLDAAFDDISEPTASDGKPLHASSDDEEPVEAPPDHGEDEELGEDGESEDVALDALSDSPPPPPAPAAKPASKPFTARSVPPPRALTPAPTAEVTELRELRARVRELEEALWDANQRFSDAQDQNQRLEAELTTKAAEAASAKSTGGKSEKEFFALREAGNKKDKEILRLKTELNEKDQELVELKEREVQFEQQASEHGGELGKRDAQIKTLTTRTEQLTAERRKMDQQLVAAKEEARNATARLTTLQGEMDELRPQLVGLEDDSNQLRAQVEEAQQQLTQAKEDTDAVRAELKEAQKGLEAARQELEEARNQLETQATTFGDETSSLRQKISDMEDTAGKHEERVTKLYGRLKGEEKVREKTKKALSIALQLLEEHQQQPDDDSATA
ncbi:MAG: response regulator [Myxococcaceae bacterium]